MNTVFGGIVAALLWGWVGIDHLLSKRKEIAHKRTINSVCKRESPTSDEWAGFARATNPDNQVNHKQER